MGKTVEVVQLAQGLLGGSYRKIFTELDLMARKGVSKKKEKKRSLEEKEREMVVKLGICLMRVLETERLIKRHTSFFLG